MLQKIKFPGLCVHACLLHASANARLWSPLSPVWKDLLKTLAAERTHADSHRRETIRVPHLWKVFLWQVKSESSPSNSCGDKSEEMIQCNVLFTRPFLSIAFKMQQCEKELHWSPIWWKTKRRDVAAQHLMFWKFREEKVKLFSEWKWTPFVKYLCLE